MKSMDKESYKSRTKKGLKTTVKRLQDFEDRHGDFFNNDFIKDKSVQRLLKVLTSYII